MQFILKIDLGNDAMQTYDDIQQGIRTALKAFGAKVNVGEGADIRDTNGNTVGKWEVRDETACTICGVPGPKHGHYDALDPRTHKMKFATHF